MPAEIDGRAFVSQGPVRRNRRYSIRSSEDPREELAVTRVAQRDRRRDERNCPMNRSAQLASPV
jgi:hypothetical protein